MSVSCWHPHLWDSVAWFWLWSARKDFTGFVCHLYAHARLGRKSSWTQIQDALWLTVRGDKWPSPRMDSGRGEVTCCSGAGLQHFATLAQGLRSKASRAGLRERRNRGGADPLCNLGLEAPRLVSVILLQVCNSQLAQRYVCRAAASRPSSMTQGNAEGSCRQ